MPENDIKRNPREPKKVYRGKIESYKSKIGNLFTENDSTLYGDITPFDSRGYWGDVIKCLTMFETDELVGGLVDRMRYTANQRYNFNLDSKYAKEEEFWREWSNSINETCKNVPIGLNAVFKSIFESLVVTGMAIPDVYWEKTRIKGKDYILPTKITLLPVLSVALKSTDNFGEEQIYLSISPEYEDLLKQTPSEDVPYTIQYMGDAQSPDKNSRTAVIEKTTAEAIKFNWNPNKSTLYPSPILKRAFKSIALRHKFFETDLSLLDGIIERIVQIKVGNENIELMPDTDDADGDITMAANMFTEQHITQYVATPYYYDIKVIQPDTTVLLKQDKYVQSTASIMNAFGIILDPSNTSNISNEDKMNIVLFKEYVKELQEHVSTWITKLCREIVRRNPKLKSKPKVTFDKPDFDDPSLKALLIQLYNYGILDIYTLLEKFDITPETVMERLQKQKQFEKENPGTIEVRSTFKQEAQNGKTKVVSNKTDTGGRPNKGLETNN